MFLACWAFWWGRAGRVWVHVAEGSEGSIEHGRVLQTRGGCADCETLGSQSTLQSLGWNFHQCRWLHREVKHAPTVHWRARSRTWKPPEQCPWINSPCAEGAHGTGAPRCYIQTSQTLKQWTSLGATALQPATRAFPLPTRSSRLCFRGALRAEVHSAPRTLVSSLPLPHPQCCRAFLPRAPVGCSPPGWGRQVDFKQM